MINAQVKISWQMIAAFCGTLLLSLTTWAATDTVARLAKVEEKQHLKDMEYQQMLSTLQDIRRAQERDHKLIVEIARRNGIYIPD